MLGWLDNLLGKRPANKQDGNPLAGKPLRYLIGANDPGFGEDGTITEVGYDSGVVNRGISIGYCNLFDERDSYDPGTMLGEYGPYLFPTDTADSYDEGVIDPNGAGWAKNLKEQFARRKRQGFEFIELDNPDAYDISDVIGAIDLAASYGLKVVAKNPFLMGSKGADKYLRHPNVFGAIVERNAGAPEYMDTLRRSVGKIDLPVWFVAFGSGRKWAETTAKAAKQFKEMRVTYSSKGEYGNSIDL